jgi:hypothetical protein
MLGSLKALATAYEGREPAILKILARRSLKITTEAGVIAKYLSLSPSVPLGRKPGCVGENRFAIPDGGDLQTLTRRG